MTRAVLLKLLAGTAGVAAAAAVVVVLLPGGPGDPARAWIDDPLHGTEVAPGPVEVVAHAAAGSGVLAVELSANGVVAGTRELPEHPALATVRFAWQATDPGPVQLVVRSRSGDGWGTPARVTVHIGLREPGAPPTPAPTTSATPSPTAGPTAQPADTATTAAPPATSAPPPPCVSVVAPTLVSPATGATVGSTSPVLRWSYGGPCTLDSFTVELSLERDFSRVLRSGTTGAATLTWTVTPALTDCQRAYWRVRGVLGGTAGPWSSAHSFVVTVGRCP